MDVSEVGVLLRYLSPKFLNGIQNNHQLDDVITEIALRRGLAGETAKLSTLEKELQIELPATAADIGLTIGSVGSLAEDAASVVGYGHGGGAQSLDDQLKEINRFVRFAGEASIASGIQTNVLGDAMVQWRSRMNSDQNVLETLTGSVYSLTQNLNLEFQPLANVIAQQGATAKAAGLSETDIAGLSGVLLSTGADELTAGKMMQQLLPLLRDPTDQANASIWQSLNLSPEKIQQEFAINSGDTVEKLLNALVSSDEAAKQVFRDNAGYLSSLQTKSNLIQKSFVVAEDTTSLKQAYEFHDDNNSLVGYQKRQASADRRDVSVTQPVMPGVEVLDSLSTDFNNRMADLPGLMQVALIGTGAAAAYGGKGLLKRGVGRILNRRGQDGSGDTGGADLTRSMEDLSETLEDTAKEAKNAAESLRELNKELAEISNADIDKAELRKRKRESKKSKGKKTVGRRSGSVKAGSILTQEVPDQDTSKDKKTSRGRQWFQRISRKLPGVRNALALTDLAVAVKNNGDGIGQALGDLTGGIGGASIGAALGSLLIPIPVVGTAIGGVVGGYLGGELGSFAGDQVDNLISMLWDDSDSDSSTTKPTDQNQNGKLAAPSSQPATAPAIHLAPTINISTSSLENEDQLVQKIMRQLELMCQQQLPQLVPQSLSTRIDHSLEATP